MIYVLAKKQNQTNQNRIMLFIKAGLQCPSPVHLARAAHR